MKEIIRSLNTVFFIIKNKYICRMIKIIVTDDGDTTTYKGKVPVYIQLPAGMNFPWQVQHLMEVMADKYLFIPNQELTEKEIEFFTKKAMYL